jgi:hypothetical protein
MRLLQFAPPQDKAGELRPGYLRELYQYLVEIGDIIKAAAHLAVDVLWQAKGDLAVGTGPATADRLGVGSNGQVLTADSAQTLGVKWATPATPTTIANDTIWDAKGDVVAGTGADAAARVAVGANNTVLTADSGQAAGVKWASPHPLTTKGDLETHDGTTSVRQAVGSNEQCLVADSGQTNGIKWANRTRFGYLAADQALSAFECLIQFATNATTTGYSFGVNGPAAPTEVFCASEDLTGAAGTDSLSFSTQTAYDGGPSRLTSVGTTLNIVRMQGYLLNGNNAGTFAFRFRREAGVGTVTVQAGSWGWLRKVS